MRKMVSSALAAAALSMMMLPSSAVLTAEQPKIEQNIRIPKPQRKAWGKQTVPHFYGSVTRKTRVRELIRKYPTIQAAAEAHPWLNNVRIEEVELTYATRIDRNKYTAEKLRPNRYRGAKK